MLREDIEPECVLQFTYKVEKMIEGFNLIELFGNDTEDRKKVLDFINNMCVRYYNFTTALPNNTKNIKEELGPVFLSAKESLLSIFVWDEKVLTIHSIPEYSENSYNHSTTINNEEIVIDCFSSEMAYAYKSVTGKNMLLEYTNGSFDPAVHFQLSTCSNIPDLELLETAAEAVLSIQPLSSQLINIMQPMIYTRYIERLSTVQPFLLGAYK